jgi:LacI family transcriptional regulator
MGVVSFNLLLEEMQCRKEELPFKPKIIELQTNIIARESSIKI